MHANKAMKIADGMIVALTPLLLETKSGPNTPTKRTASHIATIASAAHISGTRRRDVKLRFSDLTLDGSCMIEAIAVTFNLCPVKGHIRIYCAPGPHVLVGPVVPSAGRHPADARPAGCRARAPAQGRPGFAVRAAEQFCAAVPPAARLEPVRLSHGRPVRFPQRTYRPARSGPGSPGTGTAETRRVPSLLIRSSRL